MKRRKIVLGCVLGALAVVAALALTGCGASVVDRLVHTDVQVRMKAANLINEKGFSDAPPGDPAKVSTLVRVAGKADPVGPDGRVAWSIDRVLEKTDPAVLWEGLKPVLSDPDEKVRTYALRTLLAGYARIRESVGAKDEVDASLVPALLEKNADMVATALAYTYRNGIAAAKPALVKLFLEGDEKMLSWTTGEGYIAIGLKVAWIDKAYLKDVNPDLMIEPSLLYRVYFTLNSLDPEWPKDPSVPEEVRALIPKIAEIESLRLKLFSIQLGAGKNDYCSLVSTVATTYILVKPNADLGGIVQVLNAVEAEEAIACLEKIAKMPPAEVETGLATKESFGTTREQYHALVAAFEQTLAATGMQRYKPVLGMAFAYKFLTAGENDMQLCGPVPDDAEQLFLKVLAKDAADKLKEGAAK